MQQDNQRDATLNGWLNTSQTMWEQWWDLLANTTQNGYANPVGAPMVAPMFDLWNGWLEQWNKTVQQNFELATAGMPDDAQVATEYFLNSQRHAQQLFKLTSETWQAIMTSVTSPEEWNQGLERYMTQLREQMSRSADGTNTWQNSNELWQLYVQKMQEFSQPWTNVLMQLPQQIGLMNGTDTTPMGQMFNLYWDAYQQTWGRMANAPSLGLTREFNEKINSGFALWQENQRVSTEYQLLLGDSMLKAFEGYMRKMLEMAQNGESAANATELLKIWVDVADEQFLELFHSEAYATLQSQYVNSSMAFRRQQREITEIMLRMNDLPTQSDLDEAHQNIFMLRKEVKALKKRVQELATAQEKAVVDAADKTTVEKPTRSRATAATTTKASAASETQTKQAAPKRRSRKKSTESPGTTAAQNGTGA